MVEAPIPQDILKYKTKFIGNFSVREASCLAAGVCAILFSYMSFIKNWDISPTYNAYNTYKIALSYKIVAASLFGIPFFAVGFITLLGQPLEKVLFSIILENFIYPMVRKKEVHHPEYEKYTNTREWMKENYMDSEENESEGTKRSKNKNKNKNKKQKITNSSEYVGIK